MDFKDIIAELDKAKDSEEYKTFVSGLVNADRVKEYLGTEDGKKLLQPMLDSYFTKGLETWKTNNLQTLVNAEVKKLYPDKDPKDTELAKLQATIEQMQADSLKKDLTNKALKIANEKKLPVDLVQFFVGADEQSTIDNMGALDKSFAAAVAAAVDAKLKGSNYSPPDGEGGDMDGVTAAFKNMNPNITI